MPRRVRLSQDGPVIAKPGFDVDTAELKDLAFSPQWIAARIYMRGTVTVVSASGTSSDRYRRASVTYPKTFDHPPLVMVAGIADGYREITQYWQTLLPFNPGTARLHPYYEIMASTTGFTLSVKTFTESGEVAAPLDWNFIVLDTTLAA